MNTERPRILVLGYGNPGRQDDGLGPALAEAVAAADWPGVDGCSDYQLVPEDAEAASRYDVVVFADATVVGDEPFTLRPVEAETVYRFTTHSVSPGTILAMARDLFGGRCRGFLLAMRGHAFEAFHERLSSRAQANLDGALELLKRTIDEGGFDRPDATIAERPPEVLHV